MRTAYRHMYVHCAVCCFVPAESSVANVFLLCSVEELIKRVATGEVGKTAGITAEAGEGDTQEDHCRLIEQLCHHLPDSRPNLDHVNAALQTFLKQGSVPDTDTLLLEAALCKPALQTIQRSVAKSSEKLQLQKWNRHAMGLNFGN